MDIRTVTSSAAVARLSAAARSDAGRIRTNNEDLSLCDSDTGVFAVIDGVGGQAAGEVAAGIARAVILERLARPLGTAAERVREAIALANNEIFRQADKSAEFHGMTCVLTLALVADGHVTVGHVGDSRMYKLRSGRLRKLTHDHSPIGEREDAREISEVDAMQHPRRNEVFRDVGSTARDKDDDDFVEIIQERVEDDSAILLCTDGLSDMVSSSAIEHVVRQNAGSPQAVVDALVDAANEAGGKDNVTVVYAEGPEFARVFGAAGPPDRLRQGSIGQEAGPHVRGRAVWFALGSLAGVLAVLLLLWRLDAGPGERTIVVGGPGAQAARSIAAAMAVARPGDTVQLEPGTYEEQVVIPDGVDLIARVAGTAVLAGPAADSPAWTAITATGDLGGRIGGIRIVSTKDHGVQTGLRISGQGRTIELLDLSGPMNAGIELVGATAVAIRGSLLQVGHGPAVSMDDMSGATIANNTFVRSGPDAESALSIADASRLTLSRNSFLGYGVEILRGVPAEERRQLLDGNLISPGEPGTAR